MFIFSQVKNATIFSVYVFSISTRELLVGVQIITVIL
jgi:hypothetical protein